MGQHSKFSFVREERYRMIIGLAITISERSRVVVKTRNEEHGEDGELRFTVEKTKSQRC